MKKIFLSSVFVIAFAAYAIYSTLTGQPQTIPSTNNKTPDNSGKADQNKNPANTQTSQTTILKDGEYTGNSADAYFGNVQVKVTITNHLISDVQFLDYPKDRGTSLRISNDSMPILKSEAIKAQSSNVNIVSGATQTSEGFIQSLKSALVLAQN